MLERLPFFDPPRGETPTARPSYRKPDPRSAGSSRAKTAGAPPTLRTTSQRHPQLNQAVRRYSSNLRLPWDRVPGHASRTMPTRMLHVTSDPIADIIGDYRAFAAMQRDRLRARGIDITPYPLSHLAVRVADWDLYVHQRTLLERRAKANRENVWNGRPISLLVLAEPLDVLDGTSVSRIELIPPVHQRVYRMGLEHLGVVVGENIDEFSRVHRAVLTGQQFQSPDVEPVYVLFEDFTHVKFYRRSFFDVVKDAEGPF